MSFFSNFQSSQCPGSITGNANSGLCEKVCLQVKKVFDACIKQVQEQNLSITICDSKPANPTYPLTLISGKSITSKGRISNLEVDALPDKCGCSRVQADIGIPIEVIYVDAKGVEGKGYATIDVCEDVVLYVPSLSIIPYEVSAIVSAVLPDGTYITGNTFSVSACITVILKIVMDVELLVPSYGYCALPPCQEYTQEVCTGFFELPLYPTGAPINCNNNNSSSNCNCRK